MTRIRMQSSVLSLIVTVAACSPAALTPTATTGVTPAVQTGAAVPTPPKEIHWFRNSAEMRGLYLEIYRIAGEQLDRLASENAPGTWAVILDADETLIDNSTFEKEQAGVPYSETAWNEWVGRKAAPALPGGVEFTQTVHRLGGKVVIVTNRDNRYCDATRENIRADSIETDLVLCRTASGDKNPRFDAVQKGTAAPGLPPLKVLMWLGDNIQDFPGLSQSLRGGADAGYANFGKTWFLLPNPMYGSWEKSPYN
jgi:5'-nucleotidase (lipoprotein e(P4) family)